MGNIRESKEEVYDWDESVYLIEEEDYVEGGEDGVSNRQATQLTRRTRDLFNRIADLLRKVIKGDSDTLASAKTYTDTTISATAATTLNSAKEYADIKVSSLVDSSPETLNTLNELAAALGDDPNFATTVANQIGTKVDKTDPRLSDARPANGGTANYANTAGSASASDVYPWAKASTKPYYSWNEIQSRPEIVAGKTVNPDDEKDVPLNTYGCLVSTSSSGSMQFFQPHVQGGTPRLFFRNGFDYNNRWSNWGEACLTTDPRLSNARPASDVQPWAKSATKPSYTINELTNNNLLVKHIGALSENANETSYGRNGGWNEPFNGASSGYYNLYTGGSASSILLKHYYHDNNIYFKKSIDANRWLSDWNHFWTSDNFNPETKANSSDVMKVLRAGKVGADGGEVKKKGWFTSKLLGSMKYIVTHDIGHTNYMTLASCVHSSQVHDISVIEEAANYTEFLIGGTSGTSYSGFNFIILEIQ